MCLFNQLHVGAAFSRDKALEMAMIEFFPSSSKFGSFQLVWSPEIMDLGAIAGRLSEHASTGTAIALPIHNIFNDSPLT